MRHILGDRSGSLTLSGLNYRPWNSESWVTTDDRVRGGSSQSYLTVDRREKACFHGNLDTSTLGGAGFASQHTEGPLDLDLSAYQGIVINVSGSTDGKRYALTLKDCIPGRRDDGRRKSGISWQADFIPQGSGDVVLNWKDFKATYRGKDKPDAEPLDLANIKRIGLMMRRYVSLFVKIWNIIADLGCSVSLISKMVGFHWRWPT